MQTRAAIPRKGIFQLLVRTKEDYIVEIQVIPSELYTLKNSHGHKDYTEYRVFLEIIKRLKRSQ